MTDGADASGNHINLSCLLVQEPVLPAIYEELELCSDDDSVSELGSFATSSHMCDSPPSVFQFD